MNQAFLTDEKPRPGLRPLSVHVGLAMAECAYARKELGASEQELTAMLEGIRKYQDHPFRRTMPELPIVWRGGTARLHYCAANTAVRTGQNLLIVPSMINKATVLDLLPGKSFVRWLAGQGFDVYMLDWGASVADPAQQTIDELIGVRLCGALDFVAKQAGSFHALGYCMGGTILAAAAATWRPESQQKALSSLTFLASPWNFTAGDRLVADHVRIGTPGALQMISHRGCLPAEWIQSVFAAANAGRAMEKFIRFAAMDQDSEAARLFVVTEDWLNDGLDLPAGVAQHCIMDWYGQNLPAQHKWCVGDKVVDLSTLDMPVLVVASDRDQLVPADSSLAMLPHLRYGSVLQPPCGHVGMMSGRRAEEKLWQKLADWLIRPR